jgi:tetratricopeptide (TPR) repeat protein
MILKMILLLLVSLILLILLMLPNIAITFGLSHIPRNTLLWPSLEITPSPLTVLNPSPSNSNSSSTQSLQEQQAISAAQNDVTIANTVITFTGVFVGIVTAAVAIAGYFGISEVFKIRNLRTNFELNINEINNKADQVEKRFDKKVEGFESKVQKFNTKLNQLSSDFDNLRFLDISYYFNEGTKAYRLGDNEHAVEYYKQALKFQPNQPQILERLGRAYSNLNDMQEAIECLEKALSLNPNNESVLRSLGLYYRYSDKERAIEYFNRCLRINDSDYEAWDFLGLLNRDQGHIDEAISAHEKALRLEKRPETEFYLSILLLYSPKGDKIRAKELMSTAHKGTFEKEHDQRIRPVWKILIQTGVLIIDDKKEDALELIQTLTQYITTERIYKAVEGHLQFLLEGTNHKEWEKEFMDIVKLKEK